MCAEFETTLPVAAMKLITEFNEIFRDMAEAVLGDDRLSITIGNRTMHIRLPMVIGAEFYGFV